MMAAADSSPLTTHVLNTGDGVPAARMALSLHRLDSNLIIWNLLSVGYMFLLINKEGGLVLNYVVMTPKNNRS